MGLLILCSWTLPLSYYLSIILKIIVRLPRKGVRQDVCNLVRLVTSCRDGAIFFKFFIIIFQHEEYVFIMIKFQIRSLWWHNWNSYTWSSQTNASFTGSSSDYRAGRIDLAAVLSLRLQFLVITKFLSSSHAVLEWMHKNQSGIWIGTTKF